MLKETFVAEARPILGWDGLYEAHSDGSIWSVERVVRRANSTMRIRAKRLSPATTKFGYLSVSLCRNGTCKTFLSHQLVCRAFRGQPDESMEVNHIDGSKINNQVVNLEWASRNENMKHSYAVTGRTPYQKGVRGEEKSSIPVIGTCVSSGQKKYFPSIASTADAEFTPANVQKALRGQIRNHKKHTWSYANEK